MCKIEQWGYIRPSTLFGFQGTASEALNSPFGQVGQMISMDRNDPNRTFFVRHCFDLVRNSQSEWRVIDICVADPLDNPYPNDESETHVRQDGRCNLDQYLALRDRGFLKFGGRNLEGMSSFVPQGCGTHLNLSHVASYFRLLSGL